MRYQIGIFEGVFSVRSAISVQNETSWQTIRVCDSLAMVSNLGGVVVCDCRLENKQIERLKKDYSVWDRVRDIGVFRADLVVKTT